MPSWLSWLIYISPFRYGLEAYFRNEFDGTENEYVLAEYGFDYGLWPCIAGLFGFTIFWRFIAFIVLRMLIRNIN